MIAPLFFVQQKKVLVEDVVLYSSVFAALAYVKQISTVDLDLKEGSVFRGETYTPMLPHPYNWQTWSNLNWEANGWESLSVYAKDPNMPSSENEIQDNNFLGFFLQKILLPAMDRYNLGIRENGILFSQIPPRGYLDAAMYEIRDRAEETQQCLSLYDMMVSHAIRFINLRDDKPIENVFYSGTDLLFSDEQLAKTVEICIWDGGAFIKMQNTKSIEQKHKTSRIGVSGDEWDAMQSRLLDNEAIFVEPEEPTIFEKVFGKRNVAYAIIPIVNAREIFGLVCLTEVTRSSQIIVALKIIANMLATTLSNQRIRKVLEAKNQELSAYNEALSQHNQHLRLLSEVVERVLECASEETLYYAIAEYMETIYPEQSGCLYITEKGREGLRQVMKLNWGPDAEMISVAVKPGVAGLYEYALDQAYRDDKLVKIVVGTEQTNLGFVAIYDRHVQLTKAQESTDTLAKIVIEKIANGIIRLREINARTYRDSLTAAFNRRYYDAILAPDEKLWKTATLVIIDIDDFKIVNDTYGHIAGDSALRDLGEVLLGALRSGDTVVRYGGEEFVILLHNVDEATAKMRIDEIRDRVMSRSFKHQGKKFSISFSAGIVHDENADSLEDLFSQADVALYQAKHNGKKQSVIAQKVLIA